MDLKVLGLGLTATNWPQFVSLGGCVVVVTWESGLSTSQQLSLISYHLFGGEVSRGHSGHRSHPAG